MVMPESVAYLSVLAMFWITTDTVFVSFTFSVVGIWFELSSSAMSRYWEYEL